MLFRFLYSEVFFLVATVVAVSASLSDVIIRSALQNAAVDCQSCLGLLTSLKPVAQLGDDALITQLTGICIQLGAASPDVCAGVVAGAGPVLGQDLRRINTTGPTAEKLCDALMGVCASKAVTPFTVHFPKPPPAYPKVFKSRGRTPFRVVHLSDVHIDHEYTPGSEANCTKPICCRDFADSPTVPTLPAGPNGNSHCDSPVSLADSMLAAVESLKPKFSIFTGDVADRAVWLVNQSGVSADLRDFNAEMASKLSAPIFPSLGNHDTSPVNLFARSTSHTANNSQWVFDIQSAGWEQWIKQSAASQVDHHSGSYSALVSGTNLRIMVVNTQYWYILNFWLYDSDVVQPDPNGIIAFMVEQLQAAEDAGERVWIIGHIPLGSADTVVDQSNYYDQVLQRYKNTIAAQFFGHTHRDGFQIAYSNYSDQTAHTAVSAALIGPALTPTSGNPAFKFYDIDPDTFEVMDSSIFFTNASDAHFQVNPKWSLYYSARKTYGPLVNLPKSEPLSPAFWHNLTEVFAVNETAFQMYNTFLSRGSAVAACDDACRNTTICDLRAFRSENNCDLPTPGFSLRRRSASGGTSHASDSDACEGTGIAQIFSRMAGAGRGLETDTIAIEYDVRTVGGGLEADATAIEYDAHRQVGGGLETDATAIEYDVRTVGEGGLETDVTVEYDVRKVRRGLETALVERGGGLETDAMANGYHVCTVRGGFETDATAIECELRKMIRRLDATVGRGGELELDATAVRMLREGLETAIVRARNGEGSRWM
ncbi:Metallo-dependent phosphatase-like protein [Mycena albidolilacea]|uniref:Metallo-dependent phosphatase-like protein n=1 Tax=Mycena albidolilacea TaxID=1033008 RepID=A0AAD6ZS69_9AGAR|nr:Metallo-dependent phosphatase-like protein [Mycena albidolilacea]